ncbi:unnamed protein product [Polarella glacialis]|uniref:Uncharacterized protein n=1 Tax=Polarella glacialis TaxID=89957 RepID=A0A813JBX2_POLGL|nr:unnamed protein product [Polarella glacialis]
MSFPSGFRWGAGDAAPEILAGGTSRACQPFAERDAALLHGLGLKSYLLSISWAAVWPQGFAAASSSEAISYYCTLVESLVRLGIEPLVALPAHEPPVRGGVGGGWASAELVPHFANHAREMFRALFPLGAKRWVTLWEPWSCSLLHWDCPGRPTDTATAGAAGKTTTTAAARAEATAAAATATATVTTATTTTATTSSTSNTTSAAEDPEGADRAVDSSSSKDLLHGSYSTPVSVADAEEAASPNNDNNDDNDDDDDDNHDDDDNSDSSGQPTVYKAGHHLLLAHAAAAKVFREELGFGSQGFLGVALNADWAEPSAELESQLNAEASECILESTIGWFAGPLFQGDYPAVMRERCGTLLPELSASERRELLGSADFLAVIHRRAGLVQVEVDADDPVCGARAVCVSTDPSWPTSPSGVPVTPWALERVLLWLKSRGYCPSQSGRQEGLLVLVPNLESREKSRQRSLDDGQRTLFLDGYLRSVHHAIAKGVDLRGFYALPLLDTGHEPRGEPVADNNNNNNNSAGVVHVDRRSGDRILKLSARWLAMVASRNTLPQLDLPDIFNNTNNTNNSNNKKKKKAPVEESVEPVEAEEPQQQQHRRWHRLRPQNRKLGEAPSRQEWHAGESGEVPQQAAAAREALLTLLRCQSAGTSACEAAAQVPALRDLDPASLFSTLEALELCSLLPWAAATPGLAATGRLRAGSVAQRVADVVASATALRAAPARPEDVASASRWGAAHRQRSDAMDCALRWRTSQLLRLRGLAPQGESFSSQGGELSCLEPDVLAAVLQLLQQHNNNNNNNNSSNNECESRGSMDKSEGRGSNHQEPTSLTDQRPNLDNSSNHHDSTDFSLGSASLAKQSEPEPANARAGIPATPTATTIAAATTTSQPATPTATTIAAAATSQSRSALSSTRRLDLDPLSVAVTLEAISRHVQMQAVAPPARNPRELAEDLARAASEVRSAEAAANAALSAEDWRGSQAAAAAAACILWGSQRRS